MKDSEGSERLEKETMPVSSDAPPAVLLVDEDRKVHVLFDHLFRNSGIIVDHARNAREALPRVHRGYGLVVTDLHMPSMGGIELLKRIKQIDAAVEVIVISRDDSETAISSAMQHGAMAYLTKPFKTRDTLSRAIRRGLDRWRTTKQEEQLYQELISGQRDGIEVANKTHHIPFVRRDFPVLELLSLLNDGFVFLDDVGRVTFANVKFYETMRLFHDKHFRRQTFFLVNWAIYAAIGLLGGWAVLKDRLRPAERRGVASAVPVGREGAR